MDDIDRKILTVLQKEFPVEAEPFRRVAERVGVTEDEVVERIARLRGDSIIRRIGAVFDSRKLGFASTLCAARVPAQKLEAFVRIVNSYAGVTHNYQRSHDYNVWFTFIAPTIADIEDALKEISVKTGVTDIINMPATRKFKIDARFDL